MIALALQIPLQEFLHTFQKILSYLLHVKHNSVLRKGKDETLSSVYRSQGEMQVNFQLITLVFFLRNSVYCALCVFVNIDNLMVCHE